MSDKIDALLPCPFCNGEANILNFQAFCTVCGASSVSRETPEACAKALTVQSAFSFAKPSRLEIGLVP